MTQAVCMVAHPDDCIIFGYSFMHVWPKLDWTVCYLTYTEQDERGQEFARFWHKRMVKTLFLGFVDDWRDIDNQKISFNEAAAIRTIDKVISRFDVVLTHDSNGDYGNIHHRFVSNACKHHPRVVYFAPPGQGTHHYEVAQGQYDPAELPLHAEMISNFHRNKHANSYDVPPAVVEILENL